MKQRDSQDLIGQAENFFSLSWKDRKAKGLSGRAKAQREFIRQIAVKKTAGNRIMYYKKIIKSREMRSKILKLLSFIPDKPMLKLQYRIKTGRKLDLKNPKRFTEKLQWYKLYYRNPVMHQCVNKFEVREYVKSKGLEDTLVKLYGHYDNVNDVDWESLPDEFVIKTQQGGGGLSVLLCHDKSEATKKKATIKLAFTHRVNPSKGGGREWAYWGIPTGIVVEELLVNRENPEAGINDYKIFCYTAIAASIFLIICTGSSTAILAIALGFVISMYFLSLIILKNKK